MTGVQTCALPIWMWTIAMIVTDMAVIAAGSPYAPQAAADLTGRLDDL